MDWSEDELMCLEDGWSKTKNLFVSLLLLLLLFLLQFDYYKELSEVAGHNVKSVIAKIMKDCGKKYIYELETYRQYQFKVLDDDNFIKLNSKWIEFIEKRVFIFVLCIFWLILYLIK